jgi:hypothetical protein
MQHCGTRPIDQQRGGEVVVGGVGGGSQWRYSVEAMARGRRIDGRRDGRERSRCGPVWRRSEQRGGGGRV